MSNDMMNWTNEYPTTTNITAARDTIRVWRAAGVTGRIGVESLGTFSLENGAVYTLSYNTLPYYSGSMNYPYIMSAGGNIHILTYAHSGIVSLGKSSDMVNASTYAYRYAITFTAPRDVTDAKVMLAYNNSTAGSTEEGFYLSKVKLEKGTMSTAWSPAPSDPASGVKTSSVEVNSNGIYMDTTGTFNVNAGVGVNIKGGSGASSIGISNNDANNYFLWAGHGTPASAPFSVKRDGSVKATKIQQEYAQSFWDMADASFPAEFPVYIPSGYTIDSVEFTFQTKKARTFAKSASSTTVAYSTQASSSYVTGSASPTDPHSHSIGTHTHVIPSQSHGHSLNYGVNEKSALATSCALKVGTTTIGTYSPNPSNPVELKAYMSAGWNTVIVAPNNDARIVAFALVKLTPA
jgi:hypothetical protein